MVLHGTLPQVLAGARTVQPEHEGVLLLAALRGGKQRSRGDACHGDAGDGSEEDAREHGLPGRHPPPLRGSVCSF